MPWEKSFDDQATLGKAMQVFWAKGYESSSIADLIEGTGINRGSLYNAYGSKQQLFVLSLAKYDRDVRRAMLAELESMDNPKLAIETLFDWIVSSAMEDPDKKGCFIVNTVAEIEVHDEQVSDIVKNGLREFEAFLRRSIEVGQARGEIKSSIHAADTAKMLMALVVSLRVLGRGAYTESALQTIANQAKQTIA